MNDKNYIISVLEDMIKKGIIKASVDRENEIVYDRHSEMIDTFDGFIERVKNVGGNKNE